jgi:transposase
MFHTDRGSEFDNALIDELLDTFNINRSLSLRATPLDNAVAEAEIRNVILSEPPHTVGLVGDLWTRQCIVEYIKKKYNVEYKTDSISKVTKKWGLSSQRQVKRAYKQDEKK